MISATNCVDRYAKVFGTHWDLVGYTNLLGSCWICQDLGMYMDLVGYAIVIGMGILLDVKSCHLLHAI